MLKSLRIMPTNFPACMIKACDVGGELVGSSSPLRLSKAVPCECVCDVLG